MAEVSRRTSLMAQPPRRSISTRDIKKALGETMWHTRRKRATGMFAIAEDPVSTDEADPPANANKVENLARASQIPPSTRLFSINESVSNDMKGRDTDDTLRKNPRRRTIFIPEDTTVMTIHPGNIDTTQTDLSILNQRPKRSGRMSLSKAPKRFPLQADVSAPSVPNFTIDRAGADTGKENLPPGVESTYKDETTIAKRRSSLAQPLTSIAVDGKQNARSEHIGIIGKARRMSSIATGSARRSTLVNEPRLLAPPTETQHQTCRNSVAPKSTHSSVTAPAKQNTNSMTAMKRKYPIIEEEIQNMRQYNESWLSHQETLLTEIINRLLDTFDQKPHSRISDLRKKMLKLYNDPVTIQSLRRLEASIAYGALALPQEDRSSRAGLYLHDMAIKNNFVELWTKTYKPKALRSALEIVIGRQVIDSSSAGIREYLESCLLRNEDLEAIEETIPSSNGEQCWKRTMYRSLCLIFVLDRSKLDGLVEDNLFLSSSEHKTSEAVLDKLNVLLRGCRVDTSRALKMLGYRVTHVQDPRSEYNYHVQNIAIDFRDGRRLARLIEIVENKSANGSPISSGWLTSKLKYPALTRAVRLSNVSVVLLALKQLPQTRYVSRSTTADDLVDGHRERTIRLLWIIVGQFGAELMVDWLDMQAEINRLELLRDSSINPQQPSSSTQVRTVKYQQSLLKRWTRLLAEKHGITMTNFSTSFSTTINPFTAIIKEYLPFMFSEPVTVASSLEDQLKQIDCSPSFCSMFCNSHIIDQEFVLTTLMFLASRVLPASKTNRNRRTRLKLLAEHCASVVSAKKSVENAAAVIQRAWRRYMEKNPVSTQSIEDPEIKGFEFWLV